MEAFQLPKGFQLAGFSGGVKTTGLDMAIVHSSHPAVSAGVFTKNRVRAACVDWNEAIVGSPVRALLANSGNANACTGSRGSEDSRRLAETAARLLHTKPEEVLLASTGVIGVPLPIDTMCDAIAGLQKLHESPTALRDAAEAIMTTDTVRKISSYEFQMHGRTVRIVGFAKGSGMIHPNMATMLGFFLTDVAIEPSLLQQILSSVVDESFNMISVDGDTSTNDMALVMANGASGVKVESHDGPVWREFRKGMEKVSRELAVAIARDGEGATKLIEARVEGAVNLQSARLLARGIISSSLVKAAIFGEDANWGRILAAMGYSGAIFDPQRVDIDFVGSTESVTLMKEGSPLEFDEELASRILREKEIRISVTLSEGDGRAVAWGCDLSYEYVKINGSYRS